MRTTTALAILASSWFPAACGSETLTDATASSETIEVSADAIEPDALTAEGQGTRIRSALTEARIRWSGAQIDTYRLEVAEDLNYWSRGCVWITVVDDGRVTEASITPASTHPACSEIEWTVEQLHDLISNNANELDQFSDSSFGEHTLDVRFNELGVPVTIDFDLANGADEETSMRLTFTK